MINAAVARRYAKALLGAVLETDASGDGLEPVRRQLEALAETVAQFNGLELLLLNPAVDSGDKAAVLMQLLDRLEGGETAKRFVNVLASRERLDHFGAIAEAFAGLVDDHLGIVNAEITSPQPLDEAAVKNLQEALARKTGREVRIRTVTDPELLGGLTTRIGDYVYDGSLRFQLDRMRDQMIES